MLTATARRNAKAWRCFHCDEVFTRQQEAAEHFGATQNAEPACQIKAHEGHLVNALRKAEAELAQYRNEDNAVMRSIVTLESDHLTALRRAEETGYGRGVRDVLALACPACVTKVRGESSTQCSGLRSHSNSQSEEK